MQDAVSVDFKDTDCNQLRVTQSPLETHLGVLPFWPLHNASFAQSKKTKPRPKKTPAKQSFFTNKGTAGLITSAGFGHLLAAHVSTCAELTALSASTPP